MEGGLSFPFQRHIRQIRHLPPEHAQCPCSSAHMQHAGTVQCQELGTEHSRCFEVLFDVSGTRNQPGRQGLLEESFVGRQMEELQDESKCPSTHPSF